MSQIVAAELKIRDVFGRIGGECAAFGDWEGDLILADESLSLVAFLNALAELETLPESSWQRDLQAASCLASLIEAIKNRSMAALAPCLGASNATDWDSMCFSTPEFGNAHAWANRIRSWLAGVTVGVTPDWEEGFLLFTPLSARQSTT